MDRRVSGSEFHIAGPDTEKALVPNCVLVRWMTAALFQTVCNNVIMFMLSLSSNDVQGTHIIVSF